MTHRSEYGLSLENLNLKQKGKSKVRSIQRRPEIIFVALRVVALWLVVYTTAKLHSTKSELMFCAGLNPARGVSEIRDDQYL